jgi:hypothetical protein
MNIAYKCKTNKERLNLILQLKELGWDTSELEYCDFF